MSFEIRDQSSSPAKVRPLFKYGTGAWRPLRRMRPTSRRLHGIIANRSRCPTLLLGRIHSQWKWTAKYSTPGLLEKALGPDLKKDSSVDERLTSVGEYTINNYRPNLLLLHLIELDGAHHRNGPRTKDGVETAEREDGYIRRIVDATRQAGIFEKTAFFVVSDHGFASIDKRFSPNVALAKEGLITLDAAGKATAWKAAAWPAGGSCAIVLNDVNDKETEAKVITLFSKWAKQERSPIK